MAKIAAQRIALRPPDRMLVSPCDRIASRIAVATPTAGRWRRRTIIPGFAPTPLGQVVECLPTLNETLVCVGKSQRVTHDVGLRISWKNRPEISVRPEVSYAKLGLPTQKVTWQTRRANMVDVCLNCHNQHFSDSFYLHYDSLIDLYHEKFAKPGLALYQAAKPLLSPTQFSNPIDFTWYEIWHHEGRRARHGVSDDGPRLHALARLLRGRETLLFALHPRAARVDCSSPGIAGSRPEGSRRQTRLTPRRDAQQRESPVVSQQDEPGGKGEARTGTPRIPETLRQVTAPRARR